MSTIIFTYHDIQEKYTDRYCIGRTTLEAHLRHLAENGFQTVTIEEMLNRSVLNLSENTICLTFDDGMASVYHTVLPLLRALKLKGTIFVTTSQIGWKDRLSWSQIRELADAGVSVQSHSHTHAFLSQYSLSRIRYEFKLSQKILEDGLGRPITAFAVPNGDWNPEWGKMIQACGYQAVCTSRYGINVPPFDLFALRRIGVNPGTTVAQLDAYIREQKLVLSERLREGVLKIIKEGIGLKQYHHLRTLWLTGRLPCRKASIGVGGKLSLRSMK